MFSLTLSAFLLLLSSSIAAQSSSTAPLPNPTSISCPKDTPLIRSAGVSGNQSLSSSEKSYISARANAVLPGAWEAYLKNVNSTSPTPLPSYVSSILGNSSNGTFPKLGIAVSGGGYRAAFFGAGVLSSLDARNSSAQKTGTGGLLQAASYLSGLSGGSWLVTALAQANFPTIADLAFPPSSQANSSSAGGKNTAFGGFLAQTDLTNPGPNANATLAYLEGLVSEVAAKHNAGMPITITDLWSRALARHFLNGTTPQDITMNGTHGAGILFSDIAKLPSFLSHGQPFPIVLADTIPPNPNTSEIVQGETIPLTSEIWEFNVFETGSFDPMLASFTPTSLLGSTNSSSCIAGFDQAAYITGISSNLFSAFNTSEAAIQASSIGPLIGLLQASFPPPGVRLDSAAVPNPFKGVNPSTFSNTNETFISMVDGGLDGQVIPLQPLLVQARGVDTIIAIDADADTADNFANGTELIVSAKRAGLYGSTYPFPVIPSTVDTFIQQNLTRHGTFFGCFDSAPIPMIIYIANGGPPASGAAPLTNTSTGQTAYPPQEVQAFIDQAFDISTQGVNGSDPEWGACLACAVVDRARARTGVQRDGVCNSCFERYCWNNNGTSIGGNSTGNGGGNSTGNGAGNGTTSGGGSGSNAAGKSRVANMHWTLLGMAYSI